MIRNIAFVLLVMLLGQACQDECADVQCENAGICIDGRCDCPDGFTGLRCEVVIDPCTRLDCQNSDTCLVDNQGIARCICSPGFEGAKCDSLWTQKYLGVYDVVEDCDLNEQFVVEVLPGPRFDEITLVNFHNKAGQGGTAKVVVRVPRAQEVVVPEQFMHFGRVTGSGGFGPGASQFTLIYRIIQNSDTLDCAAVFNRR
ncbi:MAG: calcium-binding EGF-like domain-containing protein [Bacteroidia bacterium]